MAFYTGSAVNVTGLLTALQNACTTNGWSLNANILSKAGCYVEIAISGNGLSIVCGTGQTNGVLTGEMRAADNRRIYSSLAGIGQSISYPLTYNIHVFDKEVYLFVNYNVDHWSYIAFGQSPVAGLPGTGNWYGGIGIGGDSYTYPGGVTNDGKNGHLFSMLFSTRSLAGTIGNTTQQVNSFFHHGLDGNDWSCSGSGVGSFANAGWTSMPSQASASLVASPAQNLQPNAWNGEAILLPITPAVYHQADDTLAIVGDLKYARYTRIDNYEPGQVITIGNLKYKVYPWLKKNTAARDGEDYLNFNPTNYDVRRVQHSGTFAVAILYDGD